MKGILNKIFVKRFYRQQAGFFFFIFLIFFGVIAPSMQLAYHYALILGMLQVPAFLTLVGLAWLGYALKCHQFVTDSLAAPEYGFLRKLAGLSQGRIFIHFLRIQALLLLPVWGYALIIVAVGWNRRAYGAVLEVTVYVALLVLLGAVRCAWRLAHPEIGDGGMIARLLGEQRGAFGRTSRRSVAYWSVLLRYVLAEQKALLIGIKLFSCAVLYLMLSTQTTNDYDLRLPYFAFILALFGHGLLLYRCREMEDMRLRWYRTLPVPLIRRFAQAGFFCVLLLLPEMLTLGWLTPHPIRLADSLSFIVSAYSLLLLLYSLLSAVPLATGDYLKLCLFLFGILYVCVLGRVLIVLSGVFLFTATVVFLRGYLRYEDWKTKGG